MRRVILIISLCIFIITSLTACSGAKEIDDWAYVYTIGVEKGVSDKLRFTVQVPTFKGAEGGGGQRASGPQQENEFSVISIDCPTLYAGVNMINTSLSKTLNFTHAKYIVISEDIAREGVEEFMNGMARNRQIRRIMYVIVAKGSASEFVNELKPVLGAAFPKIQENLMKQGNETGLFDNVLYGEFINDMKSTYRMPTAALAAINDFSSFKKSGSPSEGSKSAGDYYAGEIPRSGGNKFEFVGTALFDGDKMVGELNGDETRSLLMARGKFNNGSITIPDPKDPKRLITADVRQQKSPGIKIAFREGEPVINVKIFLEGDLQNVQSTIDYESEKLKPVLEDKFKAFIKDELDKTMDKCKGLNTDVFGFGEKAAMQFLTIQKWEEYNWIKHFKDAEVTTEVEFIIRRTGTMMKTNPTKTTEGEE